MAGLRVRVAPPQGEPFERSWDGESLVLGRSSVCDIVLADRFLSRKHARLFADEEAWYVEDLGSRNTTFLNGQPIRGATRINPGDVVKMSGSVVTILPGPESSTGVFRSASDLIDSADTDAGDLKAEDLRPFAARLKLLNEVHRALALPISLDELLELILDRAFEQIQPEEGVIFLKTPQGLRRVATRRAAEASENFLYSRRLIREVTEKGLAALVLDTRTDERFADAPSLVNAGVRCLVAAPLLDPDGVRGMIALGSRAHIRHFTEDDMELLVSLASVAALRIRNVALGEEAERRRHLERDLALAREIQIGLLPDPLPSFPRTSLFAENWPSRTVSGDLYQVISRREGAEALLFVADVAGKGIAASLVSAAIDALAAGPIEVGFPPDEICTRVSRRLFERSSPERYATAFVASLDDETGELSYTNAGHNPPILVRADGERRFLPATGVPIGLFPAAEYGCEAVTLRPGDTLVSYTDGVTEAARPDGEEYGVTRLADMIRENRALPVDDLAGVLEADLTGFVDGQPFADDRTVVILRRL